VVQGFSSGNWEEALAFQIAILSAIIVHYGKFMIAENKISSNKGY
jgi:hypothetical protein